MKKLKLSLSLLALTMSAASACKTVSSKTKSAGDAGEMSKEDFVMVCNRSLQEPDTGAGIAILLKSFAMAKDCDDAYEKVKAIVAKGKS